MSEDVSLGMNAAALPPGLGQFRSDRELDRLMIITYQQLHATEATFE